MLVTGVGELIGSLSFLSKDLSRSSYLCISLITTFYTLLFLPGLSKIRQHKKRHNFTDTPSDTCICKNGVEDTDHCFLYCPFYNTHRGELRAKVSSILTRNDIDCNISSKLYLYGHDSLSFQDNRDILLATLEFIVKSNRFES